MPDILREIFIGWWFIAGVALITYVVKEPGGQYLAAFGGGFCISQGVMMLRNDIKRAARGERF